MVHARSINLSGNQLTSLPDEITTLFRLEILNVAQTKLTELPEDLGNLNIYKNYGSHEIHYRSSPPRLVP